MNKKVLLSLAGVGCVALFSFSLTKNNNTTQISSPFHVNEALHSTAAETFLMDSKKSNIEWVGRGVGKSHNGTVTISSGSIVVDTKQITSMFAYIDMKTIKDLDIKDEGFNKQLTDHLKSADLFNIAKYPQATFKLVKGTRLDVPEGQPNYKIVGDLNLHGVTQRLEFPATVVFAKKKVTATASVTIDRTKFGVTYNSGNYFKDLADNLIEDNIDIKINIDANIK
jgi:polyisoprenoid-binding protein YceI